MTDVRLFLVSAKKSRPSGQPWGADDYDARAGAADGPIIGRIYRARHRAKDQWSWGIMLFPALGGRN